MADNKQFNFRDYCPFADSYMEKLAFEGKLPKCEPTNVPAANLTEAEAEEFNRNYKVTMEDLFDVGGGK